MNILKAINVKNQYIKYRLPSLKSEIYLIRWFPNSITEKHNHKGKNCDYMPIKGVLYEKRFIRLSYGTLEKEYKLKPFRKYLINDTIGEHIMINHDNYVKWSLHRYYG